MLRGSLRVANNHPDIVIASNWEDTVQGQNACCEAISSGSSLDCFVPRNDGRKVAMTIQGGNDRDRAKID